MVLVLKLGPGLRVVLLHLLLLDFNPVLFDLLFHLLLATLESLLRFLLLGDVTHEHLGFEGLNHVLATVHVLVCLLDLLAAEFVLVVLLLSIDFTASNLKNSNMLVAVS